ncbi:MAG: dUTP diphosphatase [Pseudomonadota bacterium]
MTDSAAHIEKCSIMLAMQDQMNCHVDQDWLDRKREWYRAIWIECGELMEHHGWKWWKHQKSDREQALLELVDIWHFGLSLWITAERDHRAAARHIMAQWRDAANAGEFLEEVENLARVALVHQRLDIGALKALLGLLDCDFDDLYRAYVGKNVLNVFRQDHGYRSGEYIKVWNGLEDNEVLTEIARELDSDAPNFRDAIYEALQARYATVVD